MRFLLLSSMHLISFSLLLLLLVLVSTYAADVSLLSNQLPSFIPSASNSSIGRSLLQTPCYNVELAGKSYTFLDLYNGGDLTYEDPNTEIRYFMHWCNSLKDPPIQPECADEVAACEVLPNGVAYQINQGGGYIPCDSWALLNPDTPTDGLVCKLEDQQDDQALCLEQPRVAIYQFFCSTIRNPETREALISVTYYSGKYSYLKGKPVCLYYFLIATCDACDNQACEDTVAPIPKVFPLPAVNTPPHGSTKQGLSGGSIFLIIFFVGLFVYFVGGATLLKYKYQATGLDIIPNHAFWKDLPFLIKDGCVYSWGLTLTFTLWVIRKIQRNGSAGSMPDSSYEKL